MNKEGLIVDYLAEESEKIDRESFFFKRMRASEPNCCLSAWNEELRIKTPGADKGNSRVRNQSTNSLMRKSTHAESRVNQRRSSQVFRKPVKPVPYHVQNFFFQGFKNKLQKNFERLPLRKVLVNLRERKPLIKLLIKSNNEVKKVENLSEILKANSKQPITCVGIPRLKSRSEVYRYSSKCQKPKRVNFACLEYNLLNSVRKSFQSF